MKRLSITALAVAAVGFSGVALGDAEIISPSMDQLVYENFLTLEALDEESVARLLNPADVQREPRDWVGWAVRRGTCDGDANNVVGDTNAGVFNPGNGEAKSFEDGYFSATIDISNVTAGLYCFIFAPLDTGNRVTQWFYVVDDYAKVSGTIGMGEQGKGYSPTHAFEGVIGNAGAYGAVGSIAINYRVLGTSCTFTPGAFATSGSDPGIALNGLRGNATGLTGICTNGDTSYSANIFLLDRDAESNRDAPRGAIVVRWNGDPSINDYEIDGTPGTTGVDSWISLERGNVHVGTRY